VSGDASAGFSVTLKRCLATFGDVQRIAVEIATLGTKGLSVNDPYGKYTLRSLPGNFSGLHLLCIQYAGFKIIDPTVDIGFDIAAEYEEALRLQANNSK